MEFEINNDKIYIKYFHYEVSEDIWPTVSQLQELNLQKIPDFTEFNINNYLNIKVTDINSEYKKLDIYEKYLLIIYLNVFLANYHRMKDTESDTECSDISSFEDNIDIDEPDGQNSDLTPDDQNTDSITDDHNSDLTKNENGDSTIKNYSDSIIKENSDLITNDTQYTEFNCKINPNNLKIDNPKLKSIIKIQLSEFKSHLIPHIFIPYLFIISTLTLSILIIKTINKYHLKDIIYHSMKF